jgi:hypothetical protein
LLPLILAPFICVHLRDLRFLRGWVGGSSIEYRASFSSITITSTSTITSANTGTETGTETETELC